MDLWTRLWGKYHVPQNVFLVIKENDDDDDDDDDGDDDGRKLIQIDQETR